MEEDEWQEDEWKSVKEENVGSSIYLTPQVKMESEDELMFSFHIPQKRKMECEEDGEMSMEEKNVGFSNRLIPLKKRRMECEEDGEENSMQRENLFFSSSFFQSKCLQEG